MKQLLALAALTTLTTTAARADEGRKYALADLKVLVEQKAYQEAIKHLEDVRPSERNADWTELAGTAAAGMVTTSPDDEVKLTFMVSIEKQFPAVLKSKKYLVARTEAAGPAFSACFRYRGAFQECRDYALAFVDADPKNAKLTLDLARVVRMGMSHFGAVPFFKRALAANKQAVVCADEDFELAVVSGLGLDSSDTRLAEAQAMASTCWSELKDAIIIELRSETGRYHDNACALLKTKRALTPDTMKLCAAKPE